MEFPNMLRLRVLLPAAAIAFLWLQRSRLRKYFLQAKDGFVWGHTISISKSYTAQTLCVINEIAKGRYEGEITTGDQHDLLLPEKEIWDFKLGDVVKIKYSKEEFKSIQEQTIVYNCQSEAALGRKGIVTTVYSVHANMVGVYFPEMKRSLDIYPGVLENVEHEFQDAHSHRWKIGTYVITVVDDAVLSILQRFSYAGPIPKQYIGKKGRIIGSIDNFSLVDFGGTTAYVINDSALFLCNDQSPIKRENILHSRRFKIGDKVRIISNMKTLINNQKAIRSWNDKMSYLPKQEVVIVYIFRDGLLLIQVKNGRPWIINPNSVLKKNEREASSDGGMKVVPGDIVEMDIFVDEVMQETRLLTADYFGQPECLEFLQIPGRVSEVNENFMVKVEFAHQVFTWFFPSTLKKVSPEKAARFKLTQKKIDNLKIGDAIRLDVGSVNFTQVLLNKLNASQEVQMALTKSAAILVGYIDTATAVILYEDGSKYCMPKKYLTVPDKYDMDMSQ